MQQPSRQVALQYFSTAMLGLIASGCGSAGSPSGSRSLPTELSGRIHSGQQAVTQANIQLFAVGTSGDGSRSTSLMTTTVATDSNGNFVLTGAYSCPVATATFPGEVYLVASGGNPGLAAGITNGNLVLMAALGACSSLSSSTFIDVDEVTTVGTIAALAPFMTSSTDIGSTSSDAATLNAALASVNEYVNFATGTAPGPTLPSGYYASNVELNTLADAIAVCVNSAGGVAGDSSACGSLFTAATPNGSTAPTDTSVAVLDILQNPAQDPGAIYGLVSSSPPFLPTLAQTPATWALPIQAPVAGHGNLSFSAYSYPVNESAGAVALTVNRTSGNTGAVRVSYSTTNGSANAGTDTPKPNHLSILNNIVSNCGAGIGLNGVDYITISGNTVFNCAWYDAYRTSAISILAAYNSDSSTATKIFITCNRIYNNYELIPYRVTSPLSITDGEGIIIDTNMNSSISISGITYGAYTGRTYIANNVIYANGSSAVEVFQSAHVDVVNNSSYGNIHTPVATAVSTTNGTNYAAPTGRGELALSKIADANAYNNIWYSYTGQNPFKLTSCSSGCTVDYNLYYNGSNAGSAVNGPNDLYANPSYVNAGAPIFPAVDLSLLLGIPAIDSGTTPLAPATDFNGTARPQGEAIDRGAYER